MKAWFLVVVLGFFKVNGNNDTTTPTVPSAQLRAEHKGDTCDCMEYWECVKRGGQAYSYCGLTESSVCCVVSLEQDATAPKHKCGIKGFDSGAIGAAEPSEWPWQVAIIEDPGFFYVCGGSLVDESWVLTAAHCVHSYVNQTGLHLKVRLGEFDVSANSEPLPHDDRDVSSIVVHPEYDGNTLQADIALLRLENPALQSINVDTVCIPQQHAPVNLQSPCFTTGWGKTTAGGEYSKVLKEIFIPVWTDADCESTLTQLLSSELANVNSTLCAGAPGRDVCHGDGGNPLVCQEDGQWFQHGLVSYGFSCGENNNPGVYTRVASFSKWIQTTILSPPGRVGLS